MVRSLRHGPRILLRSSRQIEQSQPRTFGAWDAGTVHAARMVTESTLENMALREKLLELAHLK